MVRNDQCMDHYWKHRVFPRGIQKDILWCLIFADDIMIVSESAKGLNDRLKNWREALEDNDLWISREKTKYIRCDFSSTEIARIEEVEICIGDKILQPNESFRYLRSMFHKFGLIDEDASTVSKQPANRVEVAELRMLRWTCGKTMFDMIPNGVYKAELEVETIINKMKERRLRLKHDMQKLILSEDMTFDRNKWR
ncbi:hypothetical protein Tco_0964389, partial [Tanacetum coccineum]